MRRAGTLREPLVNPAAGVVGIILHSELCDEIERYPRVEILQASVLLALSYSLLIPPTCPGKRKPAEAGTAARARRIANGSCHPRGSCSNVGRHVERFPVATSNSCNKLSATRAIRGRAAYRAHRGSRALHKTCRLLRYSVPRFGSEENRSHRTTSRRHPASG